MDCLLICCVLFCFFSGGDTQKKLHRDTQKKRDGDCLDIGLRNEAVTHTPLRGTASLSRPTPEELAYGHVCPPSQRDALLTRSVLALLAVEDLRSAAILVRSYLSEIENVLGPTGGGRSNDELKAGYLDKTDGVAPSHTIFCSMLMRICEKDTKTAPLFTWLVRNFGQESGRCTIRRP